MNGSLVALRDGVVPEAKVESVSTKFAEEMNWLSILTGGGVDQLVVAQVVRSRRIECRFENRGRRGQRAGRGAHGVDHVKRERTRLARFVPVKGSAVPPGVNVAAVIWGPVVSIRNE